MVDALSSLAVLMYVAPCSEEGILLSGFTLFIMRDRKTVISLLLSISYRSILSRSSSTSVIIDLSSN